MNKSRCIAVATDIAERLVACSENAFTVQADRGIGGDTGVALLMAAMMQVSNDPKYRNSLHARIRAAAHASENKWRGLFVGMAGLLAICRYATVVEPKYEGLLEKCAAALTVRNEEAYTPAARFDEYDLINGQAGEAIALAVGASSEHARDACDYLAWLLADLSRWRCAHPRDSAAGPVYDLGLAHGLAGVLAALAIAAPRERKYDDALTIGLNFLCEQRHEELGWPASVSSAGPYFARSTWCYGTPGCVAALMLCASRLSRPDIALLARDALRKLAKQSVERWKVSDYALCHGFAGNALVFATVGRALEDDALVAASYALIERTLGGFEKSSMFGFRAQTAGGLMDKAGILEGAGGIGLALLTIAGACDSSWMLFFGLPPCGA